MVLLPTFLDGLAKTISNKKGKSGPCDVGRETANTLAKEAKRNESILSSTAAVKTSKSSRLASACSKRGHKGINQDCFILWEVGHSIIFWIFLKPTNTILQKKKICANGPCLNYRAFLGRSLVVKRT